MHKLILVSLFFLQGVLWGAVGARGIGLRFYLDRKNEESLARFLWLKQKEIGPNFAIQFRQQTKQAFPDELQKAKFSTASCAVLVWKDFQGPSRNIENRIECQVDYSWLGENAEDRYGSAHMILSLGEETLVSTSMIASPSFKFTGPVADYLAENLQKSYANPIERKTFELLKAKNYDGQALYYFKSYGNEDAFVMCSGKGNSSACEIAWPRISTSSTRISLGENADVLSKALCGWGARPHSGECPSIFRHNTDFRCDYVGIEMPRDTWGAIDEKAAIECRYKSEQGGAIEDKAFRIELGPLVVQPSGGRFSPAAGVRVRGPGLRNIYNAMRNYVTDYQLAHPEEEQSVNPLSNMDLPGRPPFSMESTDLRIAKSKDEPMVGFSCGKSDVSTESYYREPSGGGLMSGERYTCTIEYKVFRLGR